MGSEAGEEDILHEIYPGGDTLFLCGPSKVKLLVHSIFLTNVSKVFGAMLGPNFREGQLPTNSGPREIPLPDDDPFAMETICNVAHSRIVSDTMSPTQLLSIAYAADKYDVIPILKFPSSRWISPATRKLPQEFNIEESWRMMTAAYVLQDSESFERMTAQIVLEYSKSFRSLEPLLEDIMPADIILSLEEKRNRVRLDIMHLLWTRATYGQASCRCGWNAKHTLAWVQMLEENGLLPQQIADRRLEWTINAIQCMQETQQLEESACCDSARWHMKPHRREYLMTELEQLREATGICLTTFRGTVTAEKGCYVK